MMEDARREPRPVDGIVFWAFDRFFSGFDHAQFFKADLRLMGYILISITEPIPDGPEGRLIEASLDYIGQKRLDRQAANIKRGFHYLASQGCWTTDFPPRGYRTRKVKIGEKPSGEAREAKVLEPNPQTRNRVCRAWKMRVRAARRRPSCRAV